MKNKETVIISAFPACGKTYAYNKLSKHVLSILDSDSSLFSWIYKDGIKTNERNPNFPSNYINHIKENIGKVDYIFVSSHKEVRDALNKENIKYILVYPNKRTMKAEWVGRCFLRGSSIDFCNLIDKNWDNWMDDIKSETNAVHFVLDEKILYLEDALPLIEILSLQFKIY